VSEKNDDFTDTDTDARGPAVVVTGSVIGGFEFTGPFPTISAAAEWYGTSLLGSLKLPCSIVLLKSHDAAQHSDAAYTDGLSAASESKPTLTDEEREAVEWAVEVADSLAECSGAGTGGEPSREAATFRGLLARLGGGQ
jgi:hypothetical protein